MKERTLKPSVTGLSKNKRIHSNIFNSMTAVGSITRSGSTETIQWKKWTSDKIAYGYDLSPLLMESKNEKTLPKWLGYRVQNVNKTIQ